MNNQWWQIMDENCNEIAYPADRLNFWNVRKMAISIAKEKGLQEVRIVKNKESDIVNAWTIDLSSQFSERKNQLKN